MNGAESTIRSLEPVAKILVRELRAGRWWDRRALREAYEQLAGLLAAGAPVRVRVAEDGLYSGSERLCESSPNLDPVPVRLFQDGVRQLTFLPGLSPEDLNELVQVLTTDLSLPQYIEDDYVTLLGSADLRTIRFVVAEIADSKLLESADLPQLMSALPEVRGEQDGAVVQDARLTAFAADLEDGLVRPLRHLVPAALAIFDVAVEFDASKLAAVVGQCLEVELKRDGLAATLPSLRRIIDWLHAHRGAPQANVLAAAVFSPDVRAVVFEAMDAGREARRLALDALKVLPEEGVPDAMTGVWRLTSSFARKDALAALITSGTRGLTSAAEALGTLDGEVALALTASVRAVPADAGALAFFRAAAAHGDPRVRVEALRWFAVHGQDYALKALERALGDSTREVRFAALYYLGRDFASSLERVLKGWFDMEPFHELAYDEKRFVALVFARVVADAAVPYLREALELSNVLRRHRTDEWRAAAAAALGLLVDRGALEALDRATKSPFSGSILRAEAERSIQVLRGVDPAFQDPMVELHAWVQELQAQIEASLKAEASRTSLGPGADALATAPPGTALGDALRTERPAPAARPDDAMATLPPSPPGATVPGEGADARVAAHLQELLDKFSFDSLPPMPGLGELPPEPDHE